MAELHYKTSCTVVGYERTSLTLVPSRATSVTLDPLHEAFLFDCVTKGLKPRTIEVYDRTIKLLSAYVSKPLDQVTRLDAMNFVNHLRTRMSDRTLHHRIRVLNIFYAFLVSSGCVATDPFAGIRPKYQSQPQLTATDDQVLKLLIACAGSPSPNRNVALVKILADTGCRKEEASSLCASDVNLDNRRITFRVSKTKPRIVPLTSELHSVLGKYLEVRGCEGATSSSLWGVGNPYALVNYVVVKYSNGTLTPHSLRRKFAVDWIRKGGSETSLMRIAGWSSRSMISLYTSAVGDELAQEEFSRILS